MTYFVRATCKVEMLLDGRLKTLERLELVMDDGNIITVPVGFVCDAASIPRFFWRMCGGPMHPKNLRAGVIHDRLYRLGILTRKECDELFYRILRSEGKAWLIAKAMYFAVRWFGGSHYG